MAEVLEKEVQFPVTSKRLKRYFCSDTVFNLSKKVLTETEIGVLERGLGFVPTPNLINEENLRWDFDDFSRKMRCKWYFRNKISANFSEVPAFKPKYSHPNSFLQNTSPDILYRADVQTLFYLLF